TRPEFRHSTDSTKSLRETTQHSKVTFAEHRAVLTEYRWASQSKSVANRSWELQTRLNLDGGRLLPMGTQMRYGVHKVSSLKISTRLAIAFIAAGLLANEFFVARFVARYAILDPRTLSTIRCTEALLVIGGASLLLTRRFVLVSLIFML